MKLNITLTDEDIRFYNYCGKDSAATLEIRNKHRQVLNGQNFGPRQEEHYINNVATLEPMLYMELRGMLYDWAKAKVRRKELLRQLNIARAKLNLVSGHRLQWKDPHEIFCIARVVMGKIRPVINTWEQLRDNCYKKHQANVLTLIDLVNDPHPSLATIGEIETLLGVGLNVDADNFEDYVYNQLRLPPQYNEDKVTKEKKLTTDYEALLRLAKECQQRDYGPQASEVIKLAIEIRALSRRAGMLGIRPDPDGRIRCSYNLVGTYTGRISSYESPTGSGYNLQTIPNYVVQAEAPGGILGDRDLFIADPGYWFFQADLKGADGWTVAAYCAFLGDWTMLEDYRAGLKPHNIMTLMLRGVKANYNDRHELLYLTDKKRFDKDSWDVFACKRVFHGGNYLEGGITISRNILRDSEGKLWMSSTECEQLRDRCLFGRYPGIKRWHYYTEQTLARSKAKGVPYLIAASGQKCYFFDRPNEILTKAVAFEPQANTTWATNTAMLRLRRDKENYCIAETGATKRTHLPNLQLRVQPLHQVHDALCGQFRKDDTVWSVNQIKSYFDNPLMIAGQRITIPFDGAYGPSWGELGTKYGGGSI